MPSSMNWSLDAPYFLIALVFGYLLGSIPFGLLLTRLAGKGDIREIGSGNIGATNVLRTGSKGLAAATLLLDAVKGAAAVLIAQRFWSDAVSFAAAGALIGHLYPVWLRFHGGKGVAVAAGVFAVLTPLATGLAFALFLAVVSATRYISLGSIAATLALPPAAWMTGEPAAVVSAAAGTGALILFRHREM